MLWTFELWCTITPTIVLDDWLESLDVNVDTADFKITTRPPFDVFTHHDTQVVLYTHRYVVHWLASQLTRITKAYMERHANDDFMKYLPEPKVTMLETIVKFVFETKIPSLWSWPMPELDAFVRPCERGYCIQDVLFVIIWCQLMEQRWLHPSALLQYVQTILYRYREHLGREVDDDINECLKELPESLYARRELCSEGCQGDCTQGVVSAPEPPIIQLELAQFEWHNFLRACRLLTRLFRHQNTSAFPEWCNCSEQTFADWPEQLLRSSLFTKRLCLTPEPEPHPSFQLYSTRAVVPWTDDLDISLDSVATNESTDSLSLFNIDDECARMCDEGVLSL